MNACRTGYGCGVDLPDDTFWLFGHDEQSTAVIPSKGLVAALVKAVP
jgi:hypothetical protein